MSRFSAYKTGPKKPEVLKPATAKRPTTKEAVPASWSWFMDEALPNWVKNHYSPKESWKGKPFTEVDAQFFLKGIRELSDLFTQERSGHLPTYLNNPKYRSSYLLYWLPLQSAKFNSLFLEHPQAIQAALTHGRKTGTMKILDLGSGPATASIAVLLHLLDSSVESSQIPEKIEITLVDQNSTITQDGKSLIDYLAAHFPKLKNKVEVKTVAQEWKFWSLKNWNEENSLVLLGHLLNEAPAAPTLKSFEPIVRNMRGGGMLLMEPAGKNTAQMLSRLRDLFFEEKLIEALPTRLWGPCLHAGRCPLANSKDWCHFSIPTRLPSKWFAYLSKGLSTEKEWLKFSYVWFAAEDAPRPMPKANQRRVVSDPLQAKTVRMSDLVLLCEPETTHRYPLKKNEKLWRGDLIELKKVIS